MPHLAHLTFLVRDYDEALTFFTIALRFTVVEDRPMTPGKRFLLVAPPAPPHTPTTTLLLARATTPDQLAHVGNQTGGRVFLFLHTDDFQRDHAHMLAYGVTFLEPPRQEPYGTVAVFQDLYGNKWDLLQPRNDQ